MTEIKIPDIGDVDVVEVIELCVAAGDEVSADDPLIVIESDKASMEVPAGQAGVIKSLSVAVGDEVREGDVIAVLESTAAAGAAEPEVKTDDASDDDSGNASDDASDDESGNASDEASDVGSGKASDNESGDASGGASDDASSDDDGGASDSQGERERLEVSVPDVGDADDVVVVEVLVTPGQEIETGDLMVVLESDKASMEVPAEHAGTVVEVFVKVDDPVSAGSKLLLLERQLHSRAAPAKRSDEPSARDSGATDAAPDAQRHERAGPARPGRVEQEPTQSADTSARETPSAANVYAGPAARRLARELGVTLADVNGSGDKGRVLKEDIKAHVKSAMGASNTGSGPAAGDTAGIPAIPAVDFSKYGDTELEPLGRVREVTARNLQRAWLNIPHVTNHDLADVTDVEDFRGSLKAEGEQRGIRVTPLAFIIKACTVALRDFPRLNASLDPQIENFVIKHYCHVGIAVDTEQGLVVPVIRDADHKGIWALSEEIADLAERARTRKLRPADMQGGSFSISSLGNIGGTGFTPIINPPEVAILGVGRMDRAPVWRDDGFVPRKMLPLSLSYDHRAVNGAEAGRFLTRLRSLLADTRTLIM